MTIELRVRGQKFTGFQRGSISLTMDEPTSSFELNYHAPGKTLGARSVFPGDEVELYIDEQLVIGGYVDTTDDEDAADEVRLRAAGRSKTADLVDCTAEYQTFKNAKVGAIVQQLCEPFAVGVIVEGNQGAAFPVFQIQPGESVMDAILRAGIKRGFTAYALGQDLVLARAGSYKTDTALVRGRAPLMRSARSDSWYSRHSTYVFRGQVRSTDRSWGKAAATLKHSVIDTTITRYRPLLLVAETYAKGDIEARALVERNQRAGRGERILANVSGHLTQEGYFWRPNLLVPFRNPVLGIDAVLLVVVARMRFGESEPDVVELELTRPEAFDMVDYPAIGRGMRWT